MWRMLTDRGGDLEVRLLEHEIQGDHGTAHWEADYTFTQTGRKVHNDVRGTFALRDGLISRAPRPLRLPRMVASGARPAGIAIRLGTADAKRRTAQGARPARRLRGVRGELAT